MEPAQTKTTRKRRRRLIGAFVLVLVSLAAWWNWPRGDARFVGKWEMNETGERVALELTGWGDGKWTTLDGGSIPLCWTAKNGELELVLGFERGVTGLQQAFWELVNVHARASRESLTYRYLIKGISRDGALLSRTSKNPGPVVLRRLPE